MGDPVEEVFRPGLVTGLASLPLPCLVLSSILVLEAGAARGEAGQSRGEGAAPQSEAKREGGSAARAPSVMRGGTHSSVELCVCVHAS